MPQERPAYLLFDTRKKAHSARIPEYGRSYVEHLVGSYRGIGVANAEADALCAKALGQPDEFTWGDAFQMERLILNLLSPEELVRSAWSIRGRFREVAGVTAYDRYSASGIPTEADTAPKLALLRADLQRVLDFLHLYYALIPDRERIRKSLTESCIVMVLSYTFFLALILAWCAAHNANFLAMITTVIYAGTIGGFVSSQRRMQGVPTDGDPLISTFGLASSAYYLWLSPLLGAIFAAVLAALFIAGFLKGSFFPIFNNPVVAPNQGLSFFTFTWLTLPKSSEEYAKLVVWAFVAGFAERLVPDSLDRLTSKMENTSKDTVVPQAPPPPPPDPTKH
ncbi:MAG: hypothetical protein M3N54_06815 [Acidobacteriota bacterium]|nr:hypothetical protein [Acidobacteriota bacterium]